MPRLIWPYIFVAGASSAFADDKQKNKADTSNAPENTALLNTFSSIQIGFHGFEPKERELLDENRSAQKQRQCDLPPCEAERPLRT
mmetsp:Transcript_402/g.1176  ORF Transcript_402/g.1176 Transcript_402/m.1176 type:complete len:86 (+) Transcript_402:379-636(+)